MKTLKFALLSSIALACGGSPEAGEAEHTPSEVDLAPLEGEVPSDAMLTPPPVDVEALRAASITAEEAELLDAYFEESGRGTPTSIEGRLLHWDDVSTTVDKELLRAELLGKAQQVEKAYVNQNVADAVSSSAIIRVQASRSSKRARPTPSRDRRWPRRCASRSARPSTSRRPSPSPASCGSSRARAGTVGAPWRSRTPDEGRPVVQGPRKRPQALG